MSSSPSLRNQVLGHTVLFSFLTSFFSHTFLVLIVAGGYDMQGTTCGWLDAILLRYQVPAIAELLKRISLLE